MSGGSQPAAYSVLVMASPQGLIDALRGLLPANLCGAWLDVSSPPRESLHVALASWHMSLHSYKA